MINSEITKRVFSKALCELMKTTCLDKIRIKEICQKAGMGKKTFYYHFHDKYDLATYTFNRLESKNTAQYLQDGSYLEELAGGNPALNRLGEDALEVLKRSFELWFEEYPQPIGSNLKKVRRSEQS